MLAASDIPLHIEADREVVKRGSIRFYLLRNFGLLGFVRLLQPAAGELIEEARRYVCLDRLRRHTEPSASALSLHRAAHVIARPLDHVRKQRAIAASAASDSGKEMHVVGRASTMSPVRVGERGANIRMDLLVNDRGPRRLTDDLVPIFAQTSNARRFQ